MSELTDIKERWRLWLYGGIELLATTVASVITMWLSKALTQILEKNFQGATKEEYAGSADNNDVAGEHATVDIVKSNHSKMRDVQMHPGGASSSSPSTAPSSGDNSNSNGVTGTDPKKAGFVPGEEFLELVHPTRVRGSLASAAGRTVMIRGLRVNGDAKTLSSPANFLEFLRRNSGGVQDGGENHENSMHGQSGGQRARSGLIPSILENSTNNFTCNCTINVNEPHDPPYVPSSRFIVPESIAIMRDAPFRTESLIKEEGDAIESLKDIHAQSKTRALSELPLMSGWLCCKSNALEKAEARLAGVQASLARKIKAIGNQPPNGVVFFSFSAPEHAYRFVEEYNEAAASEMTDTSAVIAGPKERLVWENAAVSPGTARRRTVLCYLSMIVFAFIFGIPIGFLSSLGNFATLPDPVGSTFESLFDALPVAVVGIIQAYLPVVVLALFNLIFPSLVRWIVRRSGQAKGQVADGTVLQLFFLFFALAGIVIPAAFQGGLRQLAAAISEPSYDTVRDIILAVCSPAGGYFFVFTLSSMTFAFLFKLSDIVHLPITRI